MINESAAAYKIIPAGIQANHFIIPMKQRQELDHVKMLRIIRNGCLDSPAQTKS